jgi:hypothetical protein
VQLIRLSRVVGVVVGHLPQEATELKVLLLELAEMGVLEPHRLFPVHRCLMLVVEAEAHKMVQAVQAVLVVAATVLVLELWLAPLELQILVVEVVAADGQVQRKLTAKVAQADQVSSSLNTSPNLITKSSNHQAHGLHLVALLRSST